jgi:tRNA pseudouridine38/39 synthase
MQEAAARLVGEHDFRNFCKLDGSKQIQSHRRKVTLATISQLDRSTGDDERPLYVLDLVGSAFLWHQVRHIMAILFLVGQGLEKMEIVDALLNVDPNNPNVVSSIPVLEARPIYEMAEGLPLMLWECGFDDGDLVWRTDDYDGIGPVVPTTAPSSIQLLESMQTSLASTVVKKQLQQYFLLEAAKHHQAASADKVIRIQSGAGVMRHMHQYTPLLRRKRGLTPEETNKTWRNGRGQSVAAKRFYNKDSGRWSYTPIESNGNGDVEDPRRASDVSI